MRLRLIDDWKTELHRLWSVRASIFLFVLSNSLALLPSVADALNPRFMLFMFGLLIALVVFLRIVKQVPRLDT